MMDFLKYEQQYLYPCINSFLNEDAEADNPVQYLYECILCGNYVGALRDEACQAVFSDVIPYKCDSSVSDYVQTCLKRYLENGGKDGEKTVFCIGIACLQLFVQNNFCGPMTGPNISDAIPPLLSGDLTEDIFRTKAFDELILDTEGLYSLLYSPEYLLISRIILSELKVYLPTCESIDWWCMRCSFIHQKVSDERSPQIYKSVVEVINKMEANENLFSGSYRRDLLTLFYLEVCQLHLYYHDITQARDYFMKAKTNLDLEVRLTGALGRRTRWQQDDIAQLVIKVEFKDKAITQTELLPGPTLPQADLPKDVLLTDDTRLHRINYKDPDEDYVPDLRSIEQLLLFINLILIRKSSAHDVQLDEETKAFLWAILQRPKNWAIQQSSLILRSQVEVCETRAMERSMTQLEELVEAIYREEPLRFERLMLIYATSLLPHWMVQQELARVFMRLGCVKSALELFERLQLWEEVIICYNELQLRQRSAEIIKGLLEIKETPKLWCLLGDATDDIDHYHRAWNLSNQRSAKAQRCLGNYYYVRQAYKQAIEYYEMSVSLNSLQFPVWQRLGYCALQAEEWEKCANAYRKCSILEPDSFECWNNMSQAYLKLGHLHRAWKSLEEALRCNTGSWRLWDNFMLVSTSLGYFGQALNAYYRILSLKERHIDTEILGRVVSAVLTNKTDPDGKEMKGLYKRCTELLAKLTREVPTNPELWFLYGDMIAGSPEPTQESKHTAMQHYRKSVATSTQKSGWEKDSDTAILVVMKSLRLLDVAHEVHGVDNAKAALSELASLRMLLKGTIISIKKGQIDIQKNDIVESVQASLSQLEERMVGLNDLIDKLRALT